MIMPLYMTGSPAWKGVRADFDALCERACIFEMTSEESADYPHVDQSVIEYVMLFFED